MFEYIKGKIVEVKGSVLILELQNLAYRINIFEAGHFSSYLSSSDQATDQMVKVYIYEHINEQEHIWFGFSKQVFRDFFLALISVSGVGPKSALKMLGQIEPLEMMEMIRAKNILGLKNIKGIGEKTINRIVIEIAGKIEKIFLENDEPLTSSPAKQEFQAANSTIEENVRAALLSLGYKENEIKKSIDQVKRENFEKGAAADALSNLDNLETFLKECLQVLGK